VRNSGIGADGANGAGGNAFSSLVRTANSTALSLSTQATGGRGAAGSDGNAVATGTNTSPAGSTNIGAAAQGGDGIGGFANASTTATGNALVNAAATAVGGNNLLSASSGGSATSKVTAKTLGNSPVIAMSTATGGNSVEASHGGGDATAAATASGADAVSAIASARGGNDTLAEGGIAIATSTVTGVNSLSSQATAFGGVGAGNRFGTASATATGTGKSGTATATSQSGAQERLIRGTTTAVIGSTDVAQSSTAVGGASPDPSLAAGLQAVAFGTLLPTSSGASSLLGLHPAVPKALLTPQSTTLAQIVLGGGTPDTLDVSGSHTYSASIAISVDPSQVSTNGNLILGLSPAVVTGNSFDLIHFQVTEGSQVVQDKSFASLSAADAYFSNQSIDLGVPSSGSGALELGFSLDVTAHDPGERFVESFLVAIPEPSTALLVTAGLGGLAMIRRRSSRSFASRYPAL